MKKVKLYKIIKGSGGGANENTIGIEITGQSETSLRFVSKVRDKAEKLFGKGMSCDTIGTSYGVHFRFSSLEKNKKMAKLLIKLVEIEETLLYLRHERD